MSARKVDTRALRQLADDLLRSLMPDDIPEFPRQDLVTTLVRQWITYDGHATLFTGDDQAYFLLGKSPLGKPWVVPEPGSFGWLRRVSAAWQIGPERLPDLVDQLNVGQSAEVTNADGLPLRLWVNPRERTKGVEPLAEEKRPPARKRDTRQLAADMLDEQFGPALDEDEREALACSVARQWQEHGGWACLFLGGENLIATLTELEDGGCCVQTRRQDTNIEAVLCSAGVPAELVPQVLVRLNLGQEVEFEDVNGLLCLLRYDPRAGQVGVRPRDPVRAGMGSTGPPVFCPQCSAVLSPWQDGQSQQRCPLCGLTIRHST
jgi:hypothetical protein